jgi:hypothetical protein
MEIAVAKTRSVEIAAMALIGASTAATTAISTSLASQRGA